MVLGHHHLKFLALQSGALVLLVFGMIVLNTKTISSFCAYFKSARSSWWRAHDALRRQIASYRSVSWWLCIPGVALIVLNATSGSVYTKCQDPLMSLSISFVHISVQYQWCFVAVSLLVQLWVINASWRRSHVEKERTQTIELTF